MTSPGQTHHVQSCFVLLFQWWQRKIHAKRAMQTFFFIIIFIIFSHIYKQAKQVNKSQQLNIFFSSSSEFLELVYFFFIFSLCADNLFRRTRNRASTFGFCCCFASIKCMYKTPSKERRGGGCICLCFYTRGWWKSNPHTKFHTIRKSVSEWDGKRVRERQRSSKTGWMSSWKI